MRAWRFSLIVLLACSLAQAGEGETIFKTVCGACHTVGEGVRVGPDLKGATERHPEEWLLRFIKDSQALVKAGDPAAVELFKKFNNIPMPPNAYSDAQIRELLAFIRERSGGAAGPAQPAAPRGPITDDQVARGRDLFQGVAALRGGGAACNSCHHVLQNGLTGGGSLARELTEVFARMEAPGVEAIIHQPPFPMMARAYDGRPLADDEIQALSAFLKRAHEQRALQQPREYGVQLLLGGGAGLGLLLGFYGVVWSRRKRRCVNDAIHRRQIRSI